MVSAVGIAADYANASKVRTGLQAALDAGLLAGAKDGSSNWTTTALNVFSNNFAVSGVDPSTSFSMDGANYAGTATASVPATFAGIIGAKTISITAKAEVATGGSGGTTDNSCLMTLGRSLSPSTVSMTFNGAPNINMSGCSLRSNTSMTCNGHNGGASASIAVGTVSGCSNAQPNTPAIKDIYAALASNISLKCGASTAGATWTPGTIPIGPTIIKVTKGSYVEYHICGDLTVTGNGYLTGNAPALDSVIVIENGSLNVDNNSTINTMKTTIVLAGSNSVASSINFPNGQGHASILSLSPSTDPANPWQGVSLYQDPSLTYNVDDTWGPATTFNADGVVYLPNANVTISGSSASNNSKCTKFVANTFTSNGSVNLNFAQTSVGCASLGVKQYSSPTFYLAQ